MGSLRLFRVIMHFHKIGVIDSLPNRLIVLNIYKLLYSLNWIFIFDREEAREGTRPGIVHGNYRIIWRQVNIIEWAIFGGPICGVAWHELQVFGDTQLLFGILSQKESGKIPVFLHGFEESPRIVICYMLLGSSSNSVMVLVNSHCI
jgi:hypothetical protein